jgi:cellulose synthase/poly-beta-1,6-N-acetylglucosamine synthase-like glycosyltransferase
MIVRRRMIAQGVFWTSLSLLAYTFLVFPLVVVARGRLRPRPPLEGDVTPQLAIVVAAHNEAEVIGRKMDNLLSLDYPADKRSIVVVSDGSDDRTADIVRSYAERGVRLLELPRVGKATALQTAVLATDAPVLVFTDANSILAGDALRRLVAPYADPTVGGVAGNQVYRSAGVDQQASAAGEQTYWGFDRLLKEYESRAGHTIGATGALYSIRREHYRAVPPGVNDDFYLSVQVIQDGQRLVYSGRAIAYEPPGASLDAEFKRKVRVLSRAMRCTLENRNLLDPRRFGFYSVQLFSHKILRWAFFVPVVLSAVSSMVLFRAGTLYRTAAILHLVGLTAGSLGLAFRRTRLGQLKPLTVPAYFLMANWAAAKAAWSLVQGQRVDRWENGRAE